MLGLRGRDGGAGATFESLPRADPATGSPVSPRPVPLRGLSRPVNLTRPRRTASRASGYRRARALAPVCGGHRGRRDLADGERNQRTPLVEATADDRVRFRRLWPEDGPHAAIRLLLEHRVPVGTVLQRHDVGG